MEVISSPKGFFTNLSTSGVIVRVAGIFALLSIYFLRSLFGGKKHLTPAERGIAQYGKPGDQDFHQALLDGYAKHKDSFFTVPMDHHPMTIVPGKFIDEIKALPESILSFQKQVTARFLGRYTGLGVTDTLVHSVKYDLTKNIPNILPELQDETGYAINKHIGDCEDWTPYPLYHMFLYLVALLSGRIFVGHPLSRDETWLAATVAYTVDGFTGAEKLWKYPTWMHPVLQYIIPEVRKVHSYLATGSRMLGPIIKGRNASPQKFKDHMDMVQWIINNSDPKDKADAGYVTKTQMLISVVAIHTTTMTMTQVIFDLLAHPEYIDILREEIKQVRPDENAPWTKTQISALRKMDSFMKESQRFRPPGLLTMNREVQQDLKLSNGLVLPKGDHIAIAAGSNAVDPDMFDDPQTFDGLRFAKLRDLPGNENKYHFVTVAPNQLHWGAGTHACPGRFFATYEIKMLLSKILVDYDIKLPDGSTDRPQDIAIDIRVVPSMAAQVMFKKRKA